MVRDRIRLTTPIPVRITLGAATLIAELLLWGAAQAALCCDIIFAPPSVIFVMLYHPGTIGSAVVCVCAIQASAKRTVVRGIILLAAISVAILLLLQAPARPHQPTHRQDNARLHPRLIQ
jgi:hypothetical protein